MSCVLRLQGKENLLSQVQQAGLSGISPANSNGSSVNITVSNAEFFDLPGQIFDAIAFLKKYSSLLQSFVATGSIDFGIESSDIPAQTKSFPGELIGLLGGLGFELAISIYQVSSDE